MYIYICTVSSKLTARVEARAVGPTDRQASGWRTSDTLKLANNTNYDTCICMCVYIYIYICIHTHTYMCICMYVYIHIYIYIYIHIYIYTHIVLSLSLYIYIYIIPGGCNCAAIGVPWRGSA